MLWPALKRPSHSVNGKPSSSEVVGSPDTLGVPGLAYPTKKSSALLFP